MLPLSFPTRGFGGGGDGLERVGRGVRRMSGHVGCCGGVPGGSSGGNRGGILGLPRGSVRGGGAPPGVGHGKLAGGPGATGVNRLAWSVITRMLVLEVMQHMLRAVSGPEHQ